MSMASSFSSRRNEFVDASLLRISVSLCWMSGWSRRWTLAMGGLKHRAVTGHLERWQAAAEPLGERAAGGPRAAFQDAGERHVVLVDFHVAAHRMRDIVHQRHGQGTP